MAIDTLWTNELVEASSYTVVANEPVNLLHSATFGNTNLNSCRIQVAYGNLMPANTQGSFYLTTRMEYKDDQGSWRILPCYQFSAVRRSDIAPVRVLIMQPNIDTFSLGVDDSVYPLNKEVCRISRSQGELPPADIRICVDLVETDPGGPGAFVSMVFTGEMERYSV